LYQQLGKIDLRTNYSYFLDWICSNHRSKRIIWTQFCACK